MEAQKLRTNQILIKLKKDHQEDLQMRLSNHEQNVKSTQQADTSAIDLLTTSHEDCLSRLRHEHAKKLEQLESTHHQALINAKKEHLKQLEQVKTQDVDNTEQDYIAQINRKEIELQTLRQELRQVHASSDHLKQQNSNLEQKLDAAITDAKNTKDQGRKVRSELDKALLEKLEQELKLEELQALSNRRYDLLSNKLETKSREMAEKDQHILRYQLLLQGRMKQMRESLEDILTRLRTPKEVHSEQLSIPIEDLHGYASSIQQELEEISTSIADLQASLKGDEIALRTITSELFVQDDHTAARIPRFTMVNERNNTRTTTQHTLEMANARQLSDNPLYLAVDAIQSVSHSKSKRSLCEIGVQEQLIQTNVGTNQTEVDELDSDQSELGAFNDYQSLGYNDDCNDKISGRSDSVLSQITGAKRTHAQMSAECHRKEDRSKKRSFATKQSEFDLDTLTYMTTTKPISVSSTSEPSDVESNEEDTMDQEVSPVINMSVDYGLDEKVEILWSMFIPGWAITATETTTIKGQFNLIFKQNRSRSLRNMIETIDMYMFGNTRAEAPRPNVCLMAWITGGETGPGGDSMCYINCRYCKVTKRIRRLCCWAEYVPGVQPGCIAQRTDGKIDPALLVWTQPQKNLCLKFHGSFARWILRKRKRLVRDMTIYPLGF